MVGLFSPRVRIVIQWSRWFSLTSRSPTCQTSWDHLHELLELLELLSKLVMAGSVGLHSVAKIAPRPEFAASAISTLRPSGEPDTRGSLTHTSSVSQYSLDMSDAGGEPTGGGCPDVLGFR
jgi:hypothetical protein